jgi:carbon-monoxide dehydrogenase medium subunit
MYPAQFEYFAPQTLDEAVALLSRSPGDGKVLAGGHSLLPLLKLRMTETTYLVDIGRIKDLAYIRASDSSVSIGAMTTYATILRSEELKQSLPIMGECANVVGDLQVRNKGTLGGSLAHADPAGDFPAVMLALEAEVRLVGPTGERWLKVEDFFVDMLTTAMQPEEILTEIRIPKLPARTGTSYHKFAQPASRYAICGVAAVVTLRSDNTIERARVAVTGVGPKAYRVTGVEQALAGKPATAEVIAQAAQTAADGVDPLGDIHASPEYRAHLARVFAKRAVATAAERAGQ